MTTFLDAIDKELLELAKAQQHAFDRELYEDTMRKFNTGATRDDDDTKPDLEGFLNPLVLQRYAQYMLKHQTQADGQLRSSDNWQSGMSKDCYIKSGLRHVMDWWLEHRGYPSREGLQDALCGVLFNVMGYLLEDLREENNREVDKLSPLWRAPYEADAGPIPALDELPLSGIYRRFPPI